MASKGDGKSAVAEVRDGLDGRSAHIHPDDALVDGLERLDGPAEGVVDGDHGPEGYQESQLASRGVDGGHGPNASSVRVGYQRDDGGRRHSFIAPEKAELVSRRGLHRYIRDRHLERVRKVGAHRRPKR